MIELRELSFEHSSLIVEGALESVAEINPWMDWCTNEFSIENARSFIREQIEARRKGNAYEFALFNSDGLYLGGGGINNINKQCHVANVGYWIRSSETKKGYGTAALGALVAWVRAKTDLNRLEVVVAKGNIASNCVAEKNGALLEGTARCRLFNNGKYLDANIYSFTKNV